jgi:hypothetical protein
MTLSHDHRDYLLAHAITAETIEEQGIHSEGDEIFFPWRDGDLLTEQRRPWPGESGLYFWETDKDLHFWLLRDAGVTSPILLVEGTKQALAATSYAPSNYTVMGMPGCWGWSKTKLARFKGREVFLCLDADAASNLDVYEAGDKLGEKLKRYGVSLRYLRIPGSGSQGLDDYLASLDEEERAEVLAYEIANAQNKPAERRPTTRKRKMESDLPEVGDRVPVAINLDRKMVIDKITDALKDKHDGRDLFNYGEVLTRVKGHETQPLDRDRFYSMLADAVACFRYTEATDKRPAIFEPAWPDPPSIGAVMSKAEEFSTLSRVVRVPFLRPDGSICTTPGYDRETHTVLVGSGLGDLTVPEEPTQEQTRLAAKYLMSEWLGDLPFKTEADRANALALALTPFMRGLVPLVPLAVVSGLQMGVGKNLLADCLHILCTGDAAMPLPYVNSEEEMRKQLTAAFAGGAEMFVFDEAHVVEGAQLARAVTSLTYGDRVLGVSRIAKFPNQVTWVSLGNQVQVNGDMSRRVYFIYLHPSGMNVIDREAKEFRHPDLKSWTSENRTDLVSAALTVLRGWVAADRPGFSRGACMGSFEPWDRMMSGVLAYAGYGAFLTDMKERRSESDFTHSYWESHVHWLHSLFKGDDFTTRQVQEAALRDPQGYEAPPGMEDASGKAFTRQLGQGYSKHRDRNYNGVRLVKAGMGHKSTIKWRTVSENGGMEGGGGNATTPPVTGERVVDTYGARMRVEEEGGSYTSTHLLTSKGSAAAERNLVALGFDLETADADQLFTGGHEGPFVRLVGGISEVGGSVIASEPSALVDDLNRADVIYGHNILGFDLLALAHHHGADYDALAAKAVDTLALARLIDPPRSKGMPNGYYGLDQVAQRLGHQGKTDDLKGLAKRHGGYDKIPVDSRDYQEYLKGDLAATKAVYGGLRMLRMGDEGSSPSNATIAYAEREMKIVALQNRMTLNGWAVDTELLAARVEGEDAQRAAAVRELHERYGVPLARPDRFKLKNKADWPVLWQGHTAAELRERMADDPEEAVYEGFAERIPGEVYASPWATDGGRQAIINAFVAAGADSWPTSLKSGQLMLSADAMGDKKWFDPDRREALPGMLQIHGDKPGVRAVVETLSLATGARSKYAEIARYVTSQGRVHGWVSDAQGSGRWGTSKPALANMGKRGAAGQERAVMVADPGHVLLTCDLSQVDLRAMAALSQDSAYMELLQPGRDAHMEMALVYFGVQNAETRQQTKAFNHAGNYGQGPAAVSERTGIPLEKCYEIAEAKRTAYPRLAEYIEEVRAMAATGQLLDNGFGRLMRPDPERAYTQGPALMGQGAARDIMCESLLRLVERAPDVRPLLRGVVHDEVILSVPEDEVASWAATLEAAFTWEWKGVPILCEVSKPSFRWSECK